MKFLYGFVGAILGFILGGVTVVFIATVTTDGNDLATAFAAIGMAPIGLFVGAVSGILGSLLLFGYIKRNLQGDQLRRKRTLIVGAYVLAVPVLVTAMLWDVQHYNTPPPDQQLLRNFEQNRAAFDELAQMTQVDKNLARVDYNWTDPSNPQTVGVSMARIARYRQLLDKIKLHRGFEAYHAYEVNFIYWARGSAISDDVDKGYAYLTVPPKQVLSSLDDCRQDGSNEVKSYRHIEGCWYLYYDYIPD